MVQLVSVFSNVLGVLTSVNVFLHVCFLRYFNRKKPIRILIALALAGLNFWGTRDAFSTPGMALLTFSAALIGMDLIGLVIRIFGKTRVYAFYRKLIKCGFAFLVAVVYAAYGLINFHIVRKTEYTFASEKVPEALTVGVVSDSHMGNGMDDEKLLSVIRTVVDDGADVLVLAGDIVDESTEREMFFRFAEGMKSIRAPKGIYFVFGNHDASRWGGNLTRLEMETALTLSGVTVLTDESVLLDGWLRICGRKDANDERMTPGELLAGADTKKEFVLLIDHQPAETVEASEAGADLMVSGHTHNGQIFPVNVISVIFDINEIEYGHKKIGDMNAVVSSGVAGWSSAFRTAGKSEYVIINIIN